MNEEEEKEGGGRHSHTSPVDEAGGGKEEEDWRRHLECVVCLSFTARPVRLWHQPPPPPHVTAVTNNLGGGLVVPDCGVVLCPPCSRRWRRQAMRSGGQPSAARCPRCRGELIGWLDGPALWPDALLHRILRDCGEGGGCDATTIAEEEEVGDDGGPPPASPPPLLVPPPPPPVPPPPPAWAVEAAQPITLEMIQWTGVVLLCHHHQRSTGENSNGRGGHRPASTTTVPDWWWGRHVLTTTTLATHRRQQPFSPRGFGSGAAWPGTTGRPRPCSCTAATPDGAPHGQVSSLALSSHASGIMVMMMGGWGWLGSRGGLAMVHRAPGRHAALVAAAGLVAGHHPGHPAASAAGVVRHRGRSCIIGALLVRHGQGSLPSGGLAFLSLSPVDVGRPPVSRDPLPPCAGVRSGGGWMRTPPGQQPGGRRCTGFAIREWWWPFVSLTACQPAE